MVPSENPDNMQVVLADFPLAWATDVMTRLAVTVATVFVELADSLVAVLIV